MSWNYESHRHSLAAKGVKTSLVDVGDFVKWTGVFLTGSVDDVALLNKKMPVNGTGVSFAAKSKSQLVKEHKTLVKDFSGENPSMTEEYARFRQQDPKRYDKFRTKKIGDKNMVFGHNKKSGKWELQSILVER
jgi:hypothetical protein